MIGTVNRLTNQETLKNIACNHCKENNSLEAEIYSTIFVLKILPFVNGKTAIVKCKSCKKAYDNYSMPNDLYSRVELLKKESKHPWFSYIGYVLIGFFLIIGLLGKK